MERHSYRPRVGVGDCASAGVYYTEFLRRPVQIAFSAWLMAQAGAAILASNPYLCRALWAIALGDVFELLVGSLKFRIVVMNDFRRRALEGLLRRNPRQPALLGELFVGREIEPHEHAHFAVHNGFGLRLGGFARFAGCSSGSSH